MANFLRGIIIVLLLALLVGAPYWYYHHQRKQYRNFRVVKAGVLYRCGQLNAEGFRKILKTYRIGTVINLREEPEPDCKYHNLEEEICQEMGVMYVRAPSKRWYTKTGKPPVQESLDTFLEVMNHPEKYPQPVMIHCYAGEERTGAFCAYYRIKVDGWSVEEAIAEMKRCGYPQPPKDVVRHLKKSHPDYRKRISKKKKHKKKQFWSVPINTSASKHED